MIQLAALLLAAGESRRMGQLKALLPWHGATLIEHQVAALRDGGVDRIMVVLGHQAEQLKPYLEGQPGVIWVYNPNYLQGKTTSIKAGLLALAESGKPRAVLLLNVDQPRRAATIRSLLQRHRQANSLITIPTYRSKGGHPIIVDASLWDELTAIDEATQGVKTVTQRHADSTQRVEVDAPEILLDLNTPEQYQQALSTI